MLALALATAVLLVVRARGPVVKTTLAVRRDLEQHIVASGRVRVPTRVQIAAQTAGLVVAVGVVEGQRVTTGELLVQIEDSAERAAVAQAEAAVKQAAARVQQLKRVGAIVTTEAVRQAESNLARAETELARTAKLAESGAVPIKELDDANNAVAVARAQRNAASIELGTFRPTRPFAGSPGQGLRIQRNGGGAPAAPMPAPMAEKKAEKKDDEP